MNLSAITAVGGMIGAAGVIISVAYLAIQIKKQTAESRLAATRELAAQHQESMRIIAADPSMTNIDLKAVKDYLSLPADERVRIGIVFNDIFRNSEQRYLHSKGEHVEGKYLDSINKVALLLFKVSRHPRLVVNQQSRI